MPLKYKIVEHTSTKCKAGNQSELHAIKRLKKFHISNINAIKRKKMKMSQTDQRKNKN